MSENDVDFLVCIFAIIAASGSISVALKFIIEVFEHGRSFFSR